MSEASRWAEQNHFERLIVVTSERNEETRRKELTIVLTSPVPELVEESQYGPLPKVATDGRRPIDVYARPSKYAEKAAPGEKPRIAVLINGMGLSDVAFVVDGTGYMMSGNQPVIALFLDTFEPQR